MPFVSSQLLLVVTMLVPSSSSSSSSFVLSFPWLQYSSPLSSSVAADTPAAIAGDVSNFVEHFAQNQRSTEILVVVVIVVVVVLLDNSSSRTSCSVAFIFLPPLPPMLLQSDRYFPMASSPLRIDTRFVSITFDKTNSGNQILPLVPLLLLLFLLLLLLMIHRYHYYDKLHLLVSLSVACSSISINTLRHWHLDWMKTTLFSQLVLPVFVLSVVLDNDGELRCSNTSCCRRPFGCCWWWWWWSCNGGILNANEKTKQQCWNKINVGIRSDGRFVVIAIAPLSLLVPLHYYQVRYHLELWILQNWIRLWATSTTTTGRSPRNARFFERQKLQPLFFFNL